MNLQSLIRRFLNYLAENVRIRPMYSAGTPLRISPTSGLIIPPGNGEIDCMGNLPGETPYLKK